MNDKQMMIIQLDEFKTIFLGQFAMELKEDEELILRGGNHQIKGWFYDGQNYAKTIYEIPTFDCISTVMSYGRVRPWEEQQIYGYIANVDNNQKEKLQSEWEWSKAMSGILRQRQHQTDAAIVSTLKMYRKMDILEIIQRVSKILRFRFAVTAKDIKGRMIRLEALEYMEQDSQNPRLWHYNM